MGDSLDGDKDSLLHKVIVSAFYLQRKEVTKVQWDEVRAWGLKHGYSDLMDGTGRVADHPVRVVSWYDALKWCNARSEKDGLTPCYYMDVAQRVVYRTGEKDLADTMVKWAADGYRLPTEAEWEMAARGGLIGKRFPWGDTISHDQSSFYNSGNEAYQSGSVGYNSVEEPYTSATGSFAPNGYGLYDMAGNVSEWCWDWYAKYPPDQQTNPRGPESGSDRVVRGGSWASKAAHCRVAYRYHCIPGSYADVGLRPVRGPVPSMNPRANQ